MSRTRLELPTDIDASVRVWVCGADGQKLWRLLFALQDGDRVIEVGRDRGLLGNGEWLPLQPFRRWRKS